MSLTAEPVSEAPRRRVKFLAAVWGDPYIERFSAIALPSFLASGNLPALAQATDLEVVILTCRDDVATFERYSTFRCLREICTVRFVEIDDLVTTGNYGVTLTLAYARPVLACGAEMVSTHFVFMNADFVLADGSLRALVQHIEAGRSIVLGPSFRASAEALEPALEAAVDPVTGVLSIAPRKLVELSLTHPHPTTVAKIRNQKFCHVTHPNQFFWRVDSKTWLGRYYLIFMLCLKPEREIDGINSYCDYSFIPEMCPSGDEVAMGDSDEFFMLELQQRAQERNLLKLGQHNEKRLVASLAEWTTREHRRAAQYDIIYHASEIPAATDAAKADAQAFIERMDMVLPPAVPHHNHHYWIGGVESWRLLRELDGRSGTPAELAPLPRPGRRFKLPRPGRRFKLPRPGRRFKLSTWLGRRVEWTAAEWTAALRALTAHLMATWNRALVGLFGVKPHVSLLHPAWLEYRHLKNVFRELARGAEGALRIFTDDVALLRRLAGHGDQTQISRLDDLLDGLNVDDCEGDASTHVFIYLTHAHSESVGRLVDLCRERMRNLRVCLVFVHSAVGDGRSGSDLSDELLAYVEDIVNWRSSRASYAFVGGEYRRRVYQLTLWTAGISTRGGLVRRAVMLPLGVLVVLAGLLSNLWLRSSYPRDDHVPYCTTASIRYEWN